MLNFKQQELIEKFVADVQSRFPEVEFLGTSPSPENPNDLWIEVTAPEDEDREIALIEFGANKTIDILLGYGYHMLIMPSPKPNGAKAQSNALPAQA